MDYQKILKGIHQEIEPYATIGKQADYIPALAKIQSGPVRNVHSHHTRRNLHAWRSYYRLLHTKYFESIFPCHVPKP